MPRVGGDMYLDAFLTNDTPGMKDEDRFFRADPSLSAVDGQDAIDRFKVAIRAYIAKPNAAAILKTRPLEQLIQALACMKLAAEDAIIGMCVMGARAGADYDVHLRAYGI